MAISNLTGIGKNNLYLIEFEKIIANRRVYVNFYSTTRITTKKGLSNFLLTKRNNTIGVFGHGFPSDSTNIVIIPCSLSVFSDGITFTLNYYISNDTGFQSYSFTDLTLYSMEV